MEENRQLWRHVRSGETYVVWFNDRDEVIGAHGPLQQRHEGMALFGPLPGNTDGLPEELIERWDDYALVEKTEYDLARQRVEGSMVFSKAHESIILYDQWTEANHWRWVCTAPEQEIIAWAEATLAQQEND